LPVTRTPSNRSQRRATDVPVILGVRHTPPEFDVPRGACDCHVHIFGPRGRFPLSPSRRYTPGRASVTDLVRLQRVLRLDRAVIVQPTPYGGDNACLLDALTRLGPRARGVAAVDRTTPDSTLRHLHERGVRAARLNLETAGQRDPGVARAELDHLISRVEPLGWHVEMFTNLTVIAALSETLFALPATLVIDHFGRADAAKGPSQDGFDVLRRLVHTGKAYVKLSAPYAISEAPGYEDVDEIARALIAANPLRVIWGSDWPHTSGAPGLRRSRDGVHPFRQEDDGASLNRLARWTRDSSRIHRILVDNPARLYGFA